MASLEAIAMRLDATFKVVDGMVNNPGMPVERQTVIGIHQSLRALLHDLNEYRACAVDPGYKGRMSGQKFVEALGCALDQIERSAGEAVKNCAYATASRFYADAAQIEELRGNVVSNGGDVEIRQEEE